ncbi:MAG: hypothetical protein H6557_05565 [Lewinellaceae bacterium]|nr:hypothetical protein [Lewinellaceae bacterium]
MSFRAIKIILESVKKLQIDLSGLTVLTEAGSGNYIYTPLIAYYGDARKIYVWTADSSYGKGKDIVADFTRICKSHYVDITRFEFAINERPKRHIKEADIITNLGFVRPMNSDFLSLMKPGAVIPYMCEAWEVRESDIDLNYCKENNIKVAGTWENHPSLGIFNGVGNLASKLIYEANFEIWSNRILIISNDHFGKIISRSLTNQGVSHIDTVSPNEMESISEWNYDLILLADYSTNKNSFSPDVVKILNQSTISVVHLCGLLDYDEMIKNQIFVYPAMNGLAKRMTRTLAYLGPSPVINLHAAGIKVGHELIQGDITNLSQPITFIK